MMSCTYPEKHPKEHPKEYPKKHPKKQKEKNYPTHTSLAIFFTRSDRDVCTA